MMAAEGQGKSLKMVRGRGLVSLWQQRVRERV